MYKKSKFNFKNIAIIIFAISLSFYSKISQSEEIKNYDTNIFENSKIPKPDHIIILILENHAFKNIIGSVSAPYINQLANNGALFTESYAITHPSQPNYILFYSGSNQGVTDDHLPK